MFSPLERFVAFRYLKGVQGQAEGRSFLRFITYIAIGGIAVGVAALLLALSIVRGFSNEIQKKIVGFGAHVQVENFRDEPIDSASQVVGMIRPVDGIKRVAPVVQEFALLRRSASQIEGLAIWGMEAPPPYLEEQVVAGSFQFARDSLGLPGIVLGEKLADQMGIEVGDRVTAFSMRGLEGGSLMRGRPRVKQFYVAGLYETLLADFDEVNAFTGIGPARDLFSYADNQVSRFDLTLYDIEEAQQVRSAIEERVGFPIIARTIEEVFPGLFAWVNLQESIIPLVISVIIIVAAFNIVGTLLMIILEKTSEIGILASLGASRKALRRLFLRFGLLIGAVGTVIGEGVALTLGLLQEQFQLIPLPAEAYYMQTAPVELNPLDFVIVGVAALLLCAVASYIPARFASRVEPIRVIRFH